MTDMLPEIRDLKYTPREKQAHADRQLFEQWSAKRFDNMPEQE